MRSPHGRQIAVALAWLTLVSITPSVFAEAQLSPSGQTTSQESSEFHISAYVDLAYLLDFNFPENHLWRSRTTSHRVNEFAPNMAFLNVRKDATTDSRWGMEVGVQGGYDSTAFAFLEKEPRVGGADTLRHVQRANVSYLAPVGSGLTIQAGLFNSLFGYESLYAKDNANYTRSWIADNTPYMMFGVNASYPISDRLTVAGFIINSYFHLAHPNDQPSYGARAAYKPTKRLTVTETLYAGPDQRKTALEFWRFYLSSIVEWTYNDLRLALSYDVGTEAVGDRPGHPRAVVMGGMLIGRWHVAGPWSIAVRPEFYWDRNGRWTGQEQLVKAMTTTVEYALPFGWSDSRMRLEHRWDESTGAGGGFFKRGEAAPGVPGLTASQHLLIVAFLWSFDSR